MTDHEIDLALGTVDHLVARARSGALSFAADDEAAELRGLVAEAEAPEGADRRRWTAAQGELQAFFERIQDDATHVAVLRLEDATLALGWGGDAVAVLAAGAHPVEQVRTLERRVRGRLSRLRMLTLILGAAARVAGIMTVPGAGLLALPVAWRLVRSLRLEAETQAELALQGGSDGRW